MRRGRAGTILQLLAFFLLTPTFAGVAVIEEARGLRLPLFSDSTGALAGMCAIAAVDLEPVALGPFAIGHLRRAQVGESAFSLDLTCLTERDDDAMRRLLARLPDGPLAFRRGLVVDLRDAGQRIRFEARSIERLSSHRLLVSGLTGARINNVPVSAQRALAEWRPDGLHLRFLSRGAAPHPVSLQCAPHHERPPP